MAFHRVVVLALVHTLNGGESAKAPTKSDGLSIADATLLVIDGIEDEGMKLAKDLLGKERTNVNLEVEMDDDAKGTPLATAVYSMVNPEGENCMELVNSLLAHKDVDVNAALVAPDESLVPPLVLAMKAVAAGLPVGVEMASALLAHEKIAVNAMISGGKTQLGALHLAIAAAARGTGGGLELTRALVARSDIDVEAEMVGPDGTKTSPLMKLAKMLQDQPSDSNLVKAIAIVRAKAKPLADEKLQALVDAAAPKEEL